MLALAAIFGWVSKLVKLLTVFSVGNVIGGVAVSQVTEAAMRWIRAVTVVGILVFVMAQFVPEPVTSFTNLWGSYRDDLGPVATAVGYFVPMGLLTTLLDYYVLFVMALVVMSAVSRVVEFSK